MSDVVKQGRTVLFVSHNMGAVRSLCNSAVYMEHGRVEFIGDLNEAIEIYLSTGELQQASSLSVEPDPHMNMQVLSITVLDQDGNPSNRLPHDQPFRVRIQAAVRKPLARAMLILNIEDHELDTVISSSDFFEEDAEPVTRQPGVYTYEVRVPSPLLVPGSYRLTLIARQFKSRTLHRLEHVCPFELFDNGSVQARVGGKWRGKVSVPLQWECSEILPPDSMQYLENEA